MKIYEKICKARDEVRSKKDTDEKIKVLSQLMLKAFNNELHPDELPQSFTITNVNCAKSETLESVLKEEFELDVESVKFIKSDSVRGNTFEVIMRE